MMRLITPILLIVSAALFLLSCNDTQKTAPTLDECQVIANQLNDGINSGNVDSLVQLFDIPLFQQNFQSKMAIPKNELKVFPAVIKKNITTTFQHFSERYGSANGGVFRLDTVYVKEHVGHVVFGVISFDETPNFFDFEILQ